MKRFDIEALPLPGLKRVTRLPIGDTRGSLTRLFCATDLSLAGWTQPVAQINHTVTVRAGTVRGLHFQRPPHEEMKLVSCIRGEVWDVAVDIRAGSPTFLCWHAERLSAGNGHAMLIPEGFAHGFQTLTDDVEMLYCHSTTYEPSAEGGLNPHDPKLSIAWPLEIAEISGRDAGHALITDAFAGMDR